MSELKSSQQNTSPSEKNEGFDFDVFCPGTDAAAEPYHAIMYIDENGQNTGQLWGQDKKLMLFESLNAAQTVLKHLGHSGYQLRGVSKAHLAALEQLSENDQAELFVIVGFTARGDIEALPLAEHLSRKAKAGNPPPLPKKS